MAVKRTLLDDITGEEDASTVRLALDGFVVEIDLSAEGREKLASCLAVYFEHGRQVTKQRANGNAAQIRQWARSQGMEVGRKGRVPEEVNEAYKAAHSA